jgi:hypothetical protein
MGGGARSATVLHVKEPKKTGARSARARTRGQNPLVFNILFLQLLNQDKYTYPIPFPSYTFCLIFCL